jgi:hypothetical protein
LDKKALSERDVCTKSITPAVAKRHLQFLTLGGKTLSPPMGIDT